MGSSPVTATPRSPGFRRRASQVLVERALERFFQPLVLSSNSKASDQTVLVLVAFSGGPDSTALLAGLATVLPRLGARVHAAHLDHALDAGSAERAAGAQRLAEDLGVPFLCERLSAWPEKIPGGKEGAAREARYAFLARTAEQLGARFVATAHHADDQAETLLLRWLRGSGLDGLAGIPWCRPLEGAGWVEEPATSCELVRPLLGLRRSILVSSLGARLPITDPTNDDVTVPRNRIRHLLLPNLPVRVSQLGRLAAAAAQAREALGPFFQEHLAPEPLPTEPGLRVPRVAFDELPESLLPAALAWMHRRVGAPLPASAAARRELLRQLRRRVGGRVRCDCGDGWQWEGASGWLYLVRDEPEAVDFAYTLVAPGEVAIPELGLRLRLRRAEVASWMFKASPHRTGLAGLSPADQRIEVRNRRPGDRLHPLGSPGRRRLKDLLIDRRVPRRQRDRLPLLVVEDAIAWVPGLTVDERFRVTATSEAVWIAEIMALDTTRERSKP